MKTELQKQADTIEQQRVIHEFIDHLNGLGVTLVEQQGNCLVGLVKHDIDLLINYFFNIDPVKLDKERRALINKHVADNNI